jgi:archaemetzincin
MESYHSRFKVPDKNTRINAIGQISNLPNNSLKKILKTADDYHSPVSQPKEGDWLYSQKESGQTFSKFLSEGNKVAPNRRTIYINPLQTMDQQFLNNCLLYCQSFFYPMSVKLINIASLKSLHIESRINEYTGKIQYNAGEINSKMSNYVPNDAHCVVSILLDDLYPRKEWNFVFGLASYYKRVGVFSFARFNPSFFDKPEPDNVENYLLYRSCSTLVHEICHTFGIAHCVFYSCLMNGSNNLEEQAKRPLIECPVCLRKLQHSIGFDALERYNKLMNMSKKFGGYFDYVSKWYENRINSIK